MKKKIILTFFIIICAGCVLFCSILCYKNIIAIQTESDLEGGKDINKEEYIYKEDLMRLGYSVSDIEIIEDKISTTDVKTYLLGTKYKNLTNFISSPYFKMQNLERYQKYFDNTSYTADTCVLHVEIGLDSPFYTNIKDTDLTKSELMIVNKYYKLPSDYVPTLVSISKEYGSGKLEPRTYEAFKLMCDNALLENIKLKSISAYRSYSTQNSLYKSYVKRDGTQKADTYSARPGHSEHQTGLAIDVNTTSSKVHFENTKEYDWLINNAYKYGFILRYPNNKTYITGYKYEPWHWRYVGVDVATKIYEEDITYEEYVIKYRLLSDL